MVISKDIVVSVIDEETCGMIFDTKTGKYYRINSTACFIIEQIKSNTGITVSHITDNMFELFDCNYETIKKDVEDTIHLLKEMGFISE